MCRMLGKIKEQGLISFSSALKSILGGEPLGVPWELASTFPEGEDLVWFMYVHVPGLGGLPSTQETLSKNLLNE